MAHRRTENLMQAEAQIPAGEHELKGTLSRPAGSETVVVFAHGHGSGRFSPRSQFVAASLPAAGIGTLSIDLLDEDQQRDRNFSNKVSSPRNSGGLDLGAKLCTMNDRHRANCDCQRR